MAVSPSEVQRIARFERLEETPFSRAGHIDGTKGTFKELYRFRSLLRRITSREIKARYKDSVFGVFWVLIPSIVQLAIYYFAIGKVLGASRSVPDFAIFVFTGLIFWTFFSETISSVTGSLMANAGLIKKVYLPREIFPISSIGTSAFNFSVQFLVLIAATFLLGNWHYSTNLLFVPLGFAVLLIFASAIGLVLSAASVYLRDLQHLLSIALAVLFWASPIVYPYTFIAKSVGGTIWNELYLANPVTLGIIAAQRGLWVEGSVATGTYAQTWPTELPTRLVIAIAVGVAALIISHRVFRKLQANLAQEL